MANSNKLSRNKRTEAKKRKITAQPAITAKNKIRKMKKHVKAHPKDEQTLAKL